MFPLWPKRFRNNRETVPALFWNKVNRELHAALDGVGGGAIAPLNRLRFLGAGLWANLYDLTVTGGWSSTAAAISKLRVLAQALTTSDVTARTAGSFVDLISVDGSGQTANRTITLKVTSAMIEGELVLVTLTTAHASHTVPVASEGATTNNPVFTLADETTNPAWVLLMLDKTMTSDNALGEWRPVAHGDMP